MKTNVTSAASPLISVVTITYNAESTVTPTAMSVAAQTFRNFEHIVVDGASSDDTLRRIREVEGKLPRILSEPDQGLYDAMNKGLVMARGEYVLFLNAGDTFHSSDTLALYAEAAVSNPDIIYGDTIIVDEARRIIGPRHLSAPRRLTFDSFSHGMLICHQAFMVRRELAPMYDLSYRFSADYDWTIRCISATSPAKCVNLDAITINYLQDGLTDHNKRASLRERYRIMARHYGPFTALRRHISFIPRAIKRKFGPFVGKESR